MSQPWKELLRKRLKTKLYNPKRRSVPEVTEQIHVASYKKLRQYLHMWSKLEVTGNRLLLA